MGFLRRSWEVCISAMAEDAAQDTRNDWRDQSLIAAVISPHHVRMRMAPRTNAGSPQ